MDWIVFRCGDAFPTIATQTRRAPDVYILLVYRSYARDWAIVSRSRHADVRLHDMRAKWPGSRLLCDAPPGARVYVMCVCVAISVCKNN